MLSAVEQPVGKYEYHQWSVQKVNIEKCKFKKVLFIKKPIFLICTTKLLAYLHIHLKITVIYISYGKHLFQ